MCAIFATTITPTHVRCENPFPYPHVFSFKPCVICRVKMWVASCLFMALPGDFLNYLWKWLKATAKLDAKSTLIMDLPPAVTSELEKHCETPKRTKNSLETLQNGDAVAPEKYKYSLLLSWRTWMCQKKRTLFLLPTNCISQACSATSLVFPQLKDYLCYGWPNVFATISKLPFLL